MRKIYSLALLAALAAAVFVARGLAADQPSVSGKAVIGQPAPDFMLADQNGKNVSLHDFRGKIVVLEWTNPECPIVQRHYQAKTMLNLYGEYKDKDVAWLAINSTNSADNKENLDWANQQGIGYSILNDSSGAVGHAYRATNTPHMFIVGKDGKLVYRGAIDNDPQGDMTSGKINYVNQALTEILSGKAVSVPETKAYGCTVKYAN